MTVTRAPEAVKILFEYLHLTGRDKLKIRSLNFFGTIVLLVVSFGAVYGLTTINCEYENKGKVFYINVFTRILK